MADPDDLPDPDRVPAEVPLDDDGRPLVGAGSLAGLGPRAMARITDFLIGVVIPQAVLFSLFVDTTEDAEGTVEVTSYPVWLFPVLLGILAAYEIGMVAWRGQTVGMLIGGMEVVDAATERPIDTRGAVRRAVLPLAAYALSLATPLGAIAYLGIYLSPLLDGDRRRGFHDRFADDLVLRTR